MNVLFHLIYFIFSFSQLFLLRLNLENIAECTFKNIYGLITWKWSKKIVKLTLLLTYFSICFILIKYDIFQETS